MHVYIDGASRGNPGPAGIGVVILDRHGNALGEIAEYVGETTNNVAEYRALLRALEEVASGQLPVASKVVIYSDSELLVQQLNGTYRVRSPSLEPLYRKARGLMERLNKVSVRHVSREENKRADQLANRAIDRSI